MYISIKREYIIFCFYPIHYMLLPRSGVITHSADVYTLGKDGSIAIPQIPASFADSVRAIFT
jgi:hypothetical protein